MKIQLNITHIESGEEYNEYAKKIYDNDQVVLPRNKEYVLEIDYPLHTTAKFEIKSGTKGISRGKLVSIVRKYYKKVYEIEDSTTKVKPSHIPNMLNRNFTDGKFGIWGHDIGDLVLVDASVSKNNVITLGVDS